MSDRSRQMQSWPGRSPSIVKRRNNQISEAWPSHSFCFSIYSFFTNGSDGSGAKQKDTSPARGCPPHCSFPSGIWSWMSEYSDVWLIWVHVTFMRLIDWRELGWRKHGKLEHIWRWHEIEYIMINNVHEIINLISACNCCCCCCSWWHVTPSVLDNKVLRILGHKEPIHLDIVTQRARQDV